MRTKRKSSPRYIARAPHHARTHRFPRTVLLCALLLAAAGGCAQRERRSVPHEPPRLFPLRVVSEHHLLAGIHVGRKYTLTLAHHLSAFPIAVVETLPVERIEPEMLRAFETREPGPTLASATTDAAAGNREVQPLPPVPGLGHSWEAPWGVLRNRLLGFAGNRHDSSRTLRPSEKILLGGFFLPPHKITALEFVEVPRSVVVGVALGSGTLPGGGDALLVAAPPADYRGFLGGPAAFETADRDVRVWGMIVAQIPGSALRACDVLVVARLPGGE